MTSRSEAHLIDVHDATPSQSTPHRVLVDLVSGQLHSSATRRPMYLVFCSERSCLVLTIPESRRLKVKFWLCVCHSVCRSSRKSGPRLVKVS